MNMYASGASTPGEAPSSAAGKRPAGALQRQRGEEFARLLLARMSAPEIKERSAQDGQTDAAIIAAAPDPLAGVAAAILFRRLVETEDEAAAPNSVADAAAPSGNLDAGATVTETAAPAAPTAETSAVRATIEAALQGEPLPPVLAAAGGEAVWEASLHEPGGVPIEMRATRETSIGASQGAWTLNIAAPGVAAEWLARQAPRLAERLRARGVDQAHVRIESDDTRE